LPTRGGFSTKLKFSVYRVFFEFGYALSTPKPGVMFNHARSVGCIFSLFPRLIGFVFVGKLASAGAVFWTLILWRWKFRELPHSIFE